MGSLVLRSRIVAAVFLWLSSALAMPLRAQEEGHESHRGGPVPREILERPVGSRTGIGTVHQAVTTSSPQAQAFYDQGLAYLHSYVWIEAARSFHQALRLDPNMAMAYAGLTDTYIGLQDVTTARAAFAEAQARGKDLSASERSWLAIRERELESLEDVADPDKYVAYRKAINDALKLNPRDPWLWIQRGLADEHSPFMHGQAGGVDTLAFYSMALALAADNTAAHHYYAHTLENLGRTKEALEESAVYVRSAPAIPHAHHMHGHELMRAGQTGEAIAEFLKTDELENEYYRAENIPARYDWHHAHNLQLLGMSYQSLGQMKRAEAAFRQAFALPAYTEFLEFNRKAWPEFLLGRMRCEEALEAAQALTKSPAAMARLAGYTLSGQALLELDRLNEAKDALRFAEQEAEQLSASVLASLPFPGVLRAEILLREEKTVEGEELMRNIKKVILAVPGPDAWSAARFELESIAIASRTAGDWAMAESTARDMIRHDPNYAGGYFALALVAERAGDSAGAQKQFAMAARLWEKADSDLPELQTIHQATAALR
jgi:tetratricopeptide (TPR) repeat protein